MLQRREVTLGVAEQRDGFERVVAIVYLGDTDVKAALVNEGRAFAYRKYLGFENDAFYCELEDEARRHERGIWSLPPRDRLASWEWRRRKRLRQFTGYAQDSIEGCKEGSVTIGDAD